MNAEGSPSGITDNVLIGNFPNAGDLDRALADIDLLGVVDSQRFFADERSFGFGRLRRGGSDEISANETWAVLIAVNR